MSSSKKEPIAVIGLAVRLPQEAKSPEAFWKVMVQGHSARAEVPESRLNFRSHKIRASGAHFVEEDIAAFDAPFFSISPSDAETMNNMQRSLLETTFEALENAGLSLDSVAGSKTSVHIGVFSREYEEAVRDDPLDSKPNQSFRTPTTMLANRINWFYDFKGPSFTVDTACLGSLHTIHMACDGLRNGDADIAIVGGCNLMYNPNSMSRVGEMGLLSPDGISYSFDHRANGYSRGEGFGIVVLKRAGAAIRDGNTLRAVIRASGINTSGRTAAITQPSSSAQEILIRSTYQKAGLDMSLTRYFEAHGTGTSIGDSVEASAIDATFGKYRDSENPLLAGAMESMIGHLENAAGIAGLIRDVLAVEKGIIPPNIWFEKANSKIPCEAWKFKFPTKPMAWPRTGIRRASINSFGLRGANAHVVLDDALSFLEEANLQGNHRSTKYPNFESGEVAIIISSNPYRFESSMRLFVLSAADAEGVGRLRRAYKAHLVDQSTAQTEGLFNDLAFTLSGKRTHLPWRSFTLAGSLDELGEKLSNCMSAPIRDTRAPQLTFIFTGQGAQWPSMGLELLRYDVFRKTLDEIQSHLIDLGCPWLLINEVAKGEEHSRISQPSYSQPICTAIQIALIELLRDWSIHASYAIGHSSGEIAAAYCAGGLSLESAIRVAYFRGVVAEYARKICDTPMAMMAVGLSEEAACKTLTETGLHHDLLVACINSPSSVTISGATENIQILNEVLLRRGVFSRKLNVDIAYHSKYMEPAMPLYANLMGYLWPATFQSGTPVMYSVTGAEVKTIEVEHSNYWVQNLLAPVRFLDAVRNAAAASLTSELEHSDLEHIFIEIGPHTTLKEPVKEIISSSTKISKSCYLPTLVRQTSSLSTMMAMAGQLHCQGYGVSLTNVNRYGKLGLQPQMLVNLPSYPWNHSKTY